MEVYHNEEIKELVIASKFVYNITTKQLIGLGKNGEYWAEICKLLPRDRKNVVLYTVTM